MANELIPSATLALQPEVWQKEIQQAVYEARIITQRFKKLDKSMERIHVRKLGVLSRVAPADNVALKATDLTYTLDNSTDVTATPVAGYVALALDKRFIARMDQDPADPLRMAAEACLSEGIDVTGGTLIDDLTAVIGGIGQNVSEATFLDGLVAIKEAAKGAASPGNRCFVFHHRQVDDVIATTQNWAQWQIRGDSDIPVSNGVLKSVYGFEMIETGNVQSIGGLFHNGMFIPNMTFGIGFNQEPAVVNQENGLTNLLICWVDYVALTIWSDRGADYQTTTAA